MGIICCNEEVFFIYTERLSCYNQKIICVWMRRTNPQYNAKKRNVSMTKRDVFPCKSVICFHTRKPQSLCLKLKHSHLFPPKSKTLKNRKRWHALCQCYTQLSGRTSYYTHWSFSKRAVTVSDFVHNETWVFQCWILCECVCVYSYVDGLMCVCVCVWMSQIKDEACQK